MENSVRTLKVKQAATPDDLATAAKLGRNAFCFYCFVGGNASETDSLAEQLFHLKETGVFLFGIFRFPFRFEGKRRMQTAIVQYYRMKEICDAVTYLHSDGMLEVLDPGMTLQEANRMIQALEETPIRTIDDMIQVTGDMNIDVHDVQTFLKAEKGPVYIRTFTGDMFDEPLKYILGAPYLPTDYADGVQMLVNMGYARGVDMMAFQHMNLRLTDLFHKAELFKLGTYLMDEPGQRFQISILVNGLSDPYPRPEKMQRFHLQRMWLKQKWETLVQKKQDTRWGTVMSVHQRAVSDGTVTPIRKGREILK